MGQLPDLRFLRRRELSYSFTGEKVTAEQMTIVFERLRAACSRLRPGDFLTCVPSAEPQPHYQVVVAAQDDVRDIADAEIARQCDRLLGEINREYRDKRASGRLGEMRVVQTSLPRLTAGAENQFKFLPMSLRH